MLEIEYENDRITVLFNKQSPGFINNWYGGFCFF